MDFQSFVLFYRIREMIWVGLTLKVSGSTKRLRKYRTVPGTVSTCTEIKDSFYQFRHLLTIFPLCPSGVQLWVWTSYCSLFRHRSVSIFFFIVPVRTVLFHSPLLHMRFILLISAKISFHVHSGLPPPLTFYRYGTVFFTVAWILFLKFCQLRYLPTYLHT